MQHERLGDGSRLLQAVLDAPDDVAPRLIYADWLQERADPRGEFIAVQCALDALDTDVATERRAYLVGRESQLLKKHRNEWLVPIFGKRAKDCELTRGFVSYVAMRAAELAGTLEGILRVEPVRRVHVTDADVGAITASGAASKLRALDFRGVRLGGRWVRPLCAATNLTSLEELDLVLCHLGASGAEAIAEAADPATFPSLRSLHVANNHLRDKGAAALARAPMLAELRFLHLGMNGIGPEGARALVASPYLANIERLVMWSNPLDVGGLGALRERFGDRLEADEASESPKDRVLVHRDRERRLHDVARAYTSTSSDP